MKYLLIISAFLVGCITEFEEEWAVVDNNIPGEYNIAYADGNLDTLDFNMPVEIESILCPLEDGIYYRDVSQNYELIKETYLVSIVKFDCLLKITFKYKTLGATNVQR